MHEQEQVEALKAWWKENGKWLLIAIVAVAAVLGGTFGWKYWHTKQNTGAATLFAEELKQVDSNDPKRVNDAAKAVVDNYGSTIYAARAQFEAARVNIDAKDSATAATQLQWVIDHASEESLQDVARLKLASLRLDEKKYDDALKLLDTAHPDSFTGLYADMRGDILNAQGKKDEARTAYKQALDKVEANGNYHALIQQKLDALGGAK